MSKDWTPEELETASQIMKSAGYPNEIFSTLEKVVDRLCDTICSLTKTDVTSITGREWILSCF